MLVLFGSVVPASAADGDGTTVDVWAIIGVGVVLLGVLVPLMIHFNNVNRDAHKGIGENINKVEENLKAGINKVEENLKADVNKVEENLKADVNKVEENLKADVDKVEENLKADINKVEENLKADINKVEENLKTDINKVEGKVDEINIHLRDSATEAARLGRPSETRKD